MGKTYSVETARVLLELAYPGWDFPPYVIRDDGVYQSDEHREVSPSEEIFDWSPAYDMSGPKAPDPRASPMLPIPFCAAELAAFMLDGAGLMIPEALDWRIGENTPNLESLGHPRRRKAREALQEAFVLLAKAVQQNGPPNYEELASAQDLAARYGEENGAANEREGVFGPGISDNESRLRRASAVASVKEAKERAEHAGTVANRNWKEWRKKMVCALLEDRPSAPSETSSQLAIGAAMELETQAKEVRAMKRKIVFWLAPNELLIPVDLVAGTIADAVFPPTIRGEGIDPDNVKRFLVEREQTKLIRRKFPGLSSDFKFTLAELNEYLAEVGLVAEIQHRNARPEKASKPIPAEEPEAQPLPGNYYSYPQTLAILEGKFGATDREIAMWVDCGSSEGGLDAYSYVHEFADPPIAKMDHLFLLYFDGSERNPADPVYLNALEGMFFRRRDIDGFNPSNRYVSYEALKLRWSGKKYCRLELRAVQAIKDRIHQSRLTDIVPGIGFSTLTSGDNSSPPPEWALFRLADVEDIEAEDFEIVAADPVQPESEMPSENGVGIEADSAETEGGKAQENEIISTPIANCAGTFKLEAVKPEDRWSQRQFIDGFNNVRKPTNIAKRSRVDVDDTRCNELARQHELHIGDWMDLVGVGIGQHESYMVEDDRISFRRWGKNCIEEAQVGTQRAMLNDNRTALELPFPCSPSELLKFVDIALGDPCFKVPDAFRTEVERLSKLAIQSENESADIDQHTKPKKREGHRPTVKETIKPYVVELRAKFPKLTAKLLHSEAEKEAGGESSPFAKHNRGESLKLKDCHRPCSLATFEQVLSQIRE